MAHNYFPYGHKCNNHSKKKHFNQLNQNSWGPFPPQPVPSFWKLFLILLFIGVLISSRLPYGQEHSLLAGIFVVLLILTLQALLYSFSNYIIVMISGILLLLGSYFFVDSISTASQQSETEFWSESSLVIYGTFIFILLFLLALATIRISSFYGLRLGVFIFSLLVVLMLLVMALILSIRTKSN